MVREWESVNAKAELARMHRDGHCHEAVMWYVHHLLESMKTPTRWLGTSCCSSHAVKELPQNRRVRLRQQRHRS